MSDIDIAAVDSLKTLGPDRPIGEATKLLSGNEMSRWVNFGLMRGKKIVRGNALENRRDLKIKKVIPLISTDKTWKKWAANQDTPLQAIYGLT